MRKICTLITSKGTDIDENIANQNHATRTRTPKPGYLNLSNNKAISYGLRAHGWPMPAMGMPAWACGNEQIICILDVIYKT